MDPGVQVILLSLLLTVVLAMSIFRIVPEYQRLAVFRRRRDGGMPTMPTHVRGPGFTFVIPFLETACTADLRGRTVNLPQQSVMTRDSVACRVSCMYVFRILDPKHAWGHPQGWINQRLQPILFNAIGRSSLDQLISGRESVSEIICKEFQAVIGQSISIESLQIDDVQLPDELKTAFACEALAERERRAKIIAAEGEQQAAEKLAKAAEMMSRAPESFRLRELDAVQDVAVEQNCMLIMPFPIELSDPYQAEKGEEGTA